MTAVVMLDFRNPYAEDKESITGIAVQKQNHPQKSIQFYLRESAPF